MGIAAAGVNAVVAAGVNDFAGGGGSGASGIGRGAIVVIVGRRNG